MREKSVNKHLKVFVFYSMLHCLVHIARKVIYVNQLQKCEKLLGLLKVGKALLNRPPTEKRCFGLVIKECPLLLWTRQLHTSAISSSMTCA